MAVTIAQQPAGKAMNSSLRTAMLRKPGAAAWRPPSGGAGQAVDGGIMSIRRHVVYP